ncbi:MAG: hypothetical protein LQ340_004709 [Diploschistes diacapsis]|nr:MAG: hypothetical protein LQ340_004709 [Diploschistes diacapsis]
MQQFRSSIQSDISRETSPNRGVSELDLKAIGSERQEIKEWIKNAGIDTSKQVRLVKPSHMRYQHPDLAVITKFLKDFGMTIAKKGEGKLWFRGYGADQYVYYAQEGPMKFLGGAFEVESYEDMEKASKLPGASHIQKLDDAPGGGYLVTVNDPEGFPMNLIYGQEPAKPGPMPGQLEYNFENDKPRLRKFQRFKPGPAAVHKLGHYGICVQNLQSQIEFYTRNFNIVPTDFLWIQPEKDAPNKDVALFAHIDRGSEYVDHHCFFLNESSTSHVHHCSFEVHDFDTQYLGHQWLAQKGYESVWGVGRHVLGSQIFDYWWDPTGFMIEHYADGDQVNNETPIGWGPAGEESLAVWGPGVPQTFLV